MQTLKSMNIRLSKFRKIKLNIQNNFITTSVLKVLRYKKEHNNKKLFDYRIFNNINYSIYSDIDENIIISKDLAFEIYDEAFVIKATSLDILKNIEFITTDKETKNLEKLVSMIKFIYEQDKPWHDDYRKTFTIKDLYDNFLIFLLITVNNQYVIILVKNTDKVIWTMKQLLHHNFSILVKAEKIDTTKDLFMM